MSGNNRFKLYAPAFKNPKPDRQEFGDRVGETMTRKHKSLTELAQVVGVSYEMARRYATGSGKPGWEKITKIAKWLNVDPEWLAYGEGKPELKGDETVPVFDLADREMPMNAENRTKPPLDCEFIVKVGSPMGGPVKSGDVLYCTNTQISAGDMVLLKAVKPDAFVMYLVRTVEFDSTMQPVFTSADQKYPAVTLSDYKPVAKIVAVLSSV